MMQSFLCIASNAAQPISFLKPQSTTGLCGRQGFCTMNELDTELIVEPCLGNEPSQRNREIAKAVIREIFLELESKCQEEQTHYEEAGVQPPASKSNQWATYTNKFQRQQFASELLEFVRDHPECRVKLFTPGQLKFLIILQHFVSEDTNDFFRPEVGRKHSDIFEGILTDAVNSQLVKDAHRSEWSVEGRSFSLQDLPQHTGSSHFSDARKQQIARFQHEFVSFLENYLLAFCERRNLSDSGTQRLIQVVTTQMSQAGLANLDRGSQAARFLVSSQGLEQRTAYNISTMVHEKYGEALKLSILCMKTGFAQYMERDDCLRVPSGVSTPISQPKACMPSSYLYQYATLCFATGTGRAMGKADRDMITCTVLDALDEARIDPVEPDVSQVVSLV